MNDESHGDEAVDSVLRPFAPPAQEPLPPVEPSRVVPAPPPTVAEAVEDPPVPPPPPVDALEDDPWSPDAESDTDPDVHDDMPAAVDEADDVDHHDEVDHDDEFDRDDDPELVGAAASTDALVDASPEARTITLPRKPFLIGLGVLLGAVALLAVLWQSAGDDGGDVAVAPNPERIADDVDDDGTTGDTDDTPVVDDGSADALAEARAEIASLEFEVTALEERPAPALDGGSLRRIVVGADAKFVSALPGSVAVVGAFGGVSLIDPETNRVVANGNVANAATRVMRTETSVWLTNYADNQLIRVDPKTNTVAATFPFPGPDGIEKDGNTIVVASFDGEFVARVDPTTGEILQRVDVGGTPTEVVSHPDAGLWVAIFDTGEIIEIDRESFEILQRVTVGSGPVGLFASALYIWVANHDEGTIAKVSRETGEVAWTAVVGDGPTGLVLAAGSVWVTVTDEGSLVQARGSDGAVVTRTPLGGASAGGGPTGIAISDGTLWVAMQGEQSVVRIELPS